MTSPDVVTVKPTSAIERREEIKARRVRFERRHGEIGARVSELATERRALTARRDSLLRSLAEGDDEAVSAELGAADDRLAEIVTLIGLPGQPSIDPMRPGRAAQLGDLTKQLNHLAGRIAQTVDEEAALVAETRPEWAAAADAESTKESELLAEIVTLIGRWDRANTMTQRAWAYALRGVEVAGDELPYGMSDRKVAGQWEDRLRLASSEVKRHRGSERVEISVILTALANHLAQRGEAMTRPAAAARLIEPPDAYAAHTRALHEEP